MSASTALKVLFFFFSFLLCIHFQSDFIKKLSPYTCVFSLSFCQCHLKDSNATARFSWIHQQAGGLNAISEPTVFEKSVPRGAEARWKGVVAAERAQ